MTSIVSKVLQRTAAESQCYTVQSIHWHMPCLALLGVLLVAFATLYVQDGSHQRPVGIGIAGIIMCSQISGTPLAELPLLQAQLYV